ncbi:uncharacterized protein LOC124917314 [Impatiens glandulifera]|uniref:uncharacterized protein LOC124917314 n=1 Tax=Impatiens glandulifera TaxID=253017 RepID=UPI001FB1494D|nr:uncharacterized protein LOC124917314 [Impatiens glandulifera]
MYDSLVQTGLQPFLEEAGPILLDDVKAFFRSACIRGKYIVSTVRDHTFWIDEDDFSSLFDLPAEGFSDFPAVQDLAGFETALYLSATPLPVAQFGPKTQLASHGGSVSTVAPRVLEKLEKGKLEIRQEIERLEAICNQKQVPVYTAPVIEDFQIDWTTEDTETPKDIETPMPEDDEVPTSKTVEVQILEDVEVPILENAALNLEEAVTLETPTEVVVITDSDERADPNQTEQSPPTPPPEATVSVPPKEWIEDRFQELEASVSGRIDEQLKKVEVSTSGQIEDRLQKFEASISEMIDDRILEHNVSKLQPFKDSADKIFDSAIKFANATKLVVDQNQVRLAELSTGLWEEAGEREKCAQQTATLEGITSDLKKDLGRVDTTIDRVSALEKTNETLVAEVKALTEQMAEILKAKENADAAAIEADALVAKRVQERLDAEVSKDKEPPRATQLTEEEIEAERVRRGEALFPGYAEKAARLAADDAARLEREARRLAGFAKENEKKKKAAASVSAPATSASAPKKRKRPAPKKVRIDEMLNEISDPVETGTSQQADLVEDDVEEQLRSRSKRPRPSQQSRQPQPPPQPKRKKSAYEFTDSE